MTRLLPLLIAATLIATPGLATGFLFDLPDLTFPQPDSVTQSTTGPVAPAKPRH